MRRLAPSALLAALTLAACGDESRPSTTSTSTGTGGTTTTTTTGSGGQLGVDDVMGALPRSCAFQCSNCDEPEAPYVCPTLAAWSALPHEAACGAWDGTFPAPTAGQCTASAPTDEAARPAGPLSGGGYVLPDGHRIQPAGRDFPLDGDGLVGGFPMSVTPLPGTRWVLVSDGGVIDNALRLVDVDALASGAAPIADTLPFHPPVSLFYGVVWMPPGRALAAGGGDGVIYGLTVDTVTGKLGRDAAADITLGPGESGTYFAGAMDASADGKKLLVAPQGYGSDVRVHSLEAGDYGAQVGAIALDTSTVFDLRRDPSDPQGHVFYATDTQRSRLLEIDVAKGAVTRTVSLSKNPAQLVFLDATYLAVASSDGDEIALVDRATMAVAATVPVFEKDAPPGFSPSALSYDPAAKRLYAALAGVNAVEVYDVGAGAPPTLTLAGRVPTAWWPTAVAPRDDGSLVVLSGKGRGTGTDGLAYGPAHGPITSRMAGSVQHVPASALADLAAQSAVVEAGRDLAALPGRAAVSCPGTASDFPVPSDNESGPSQQIKHVILVVRENKTYDAVFGDRPDLGDGDPKLVMAGDPDVQQKAWQNARLIAQQFTNFDNFYTDAEQSLQGHVWTVFGRTTDFMERSWLTIWGRSNRNITQAQASIAAPAEGAVFQWLSGAGVSVENMGEVIGNFAPDTHYPGLYYAQGRPDIDKSCYLSGRARLRCDLPSFVYAVQSNDHTYGGDSGKPAPEVMIAVNDEASGMLLDGLSHSPMWKDTLLIITEDDPQDGGDHIDLHRSVLLMASPWVKRGYVSHGHYDMASVYKLVAHVFGVPYHNEAMRSALLPLDAFTSTPDYTPYTYLPRKLAAPCNGEGTKHAQQAKAWDFDDLDDQPGLSRQIMEMMREPKEKRGVRVLP